MFCSTVCLICVPLGVVHYTVCSSVGRVVIVSFCVRLLCIIMHYTDDHVK